MNSKMKTVAVLGVLGVVAIVLLLDRREISRLRNENADLRSQLDIVTSLQDSNAYLTAQLKAATNASKSGQSELLRLRGQGLRLRQLEQENAQLKSERQQLALKMEKTPGGAISSEPGQVTTISEVVKATAASPPENTTDLGSLELESGVAIHFDLGGGTNCIVTPTALADGNNTMQIKVGITNADGTFSELGVSRITARPDQHCSISVGDRMIALAVRMKAQR